MTGMCPHPDGPDLGERAVGNAQRLAGAVRDSLEDVAKVVTPLSRDELVALAVTLAAMVDIDRSAADLLAWIDRPAPKRRSADHPHYLPEGHRFTPMTWTEDALRLAHAAHQRGERDPWTAEGERVYQNRRYVARKARRAAS